MSGYRARIINLDTGSWAQDVPFHFRHLAAQYLASALTKIGYDSRGALSFLEDGNTIEFKNRSYTVVECDDVPAPTKDTPPQPYRVTIGQESTGDLITECEFDTKDQALAYLESAIRDDLGKPGAFLRPTLKASRSIRMVMDGFFTELSPVPEPAAVEVSRPAEPSSHRERLLTLLDDMGISFEMVSSDTANVDHVILMDAGQPGVRPSLSFGSSGMFLHAGYDSSS